jgi:NAD(P)-dependent dehydrogenase (short-subunit alcohol dehydrogenase family)
VHRFRVLVNCARVARAARAIGRDCSPADFATFERVVQINSLGTFNCIRLAASRMSQTEALADEARGVIINTAPVAAFEGQIGQAAYSASKAAIVGMTLPIVARLGPCRHTDQHDRSRAL